MIDVFNEWTLETDDWRVAMLDRAATNKRCITLVTEETAATPTRSPCCCHSLCKPGEAFDAPLADLARKKWNSMICNRGKAFTDAKKTFGAAPKRSSNTRWYAIWEQMEDMMTMGLPKIKLFAEKCLDLKWSEQSSKKLLEVFEPTKYPTLLVEMTAVVEAGRVFCQSTYQLEGDDPLIFQAASVFRRIHDTIVSFGTPTGLKKTRAACVEASNLMMALKQSFIDDSGLNAAQAEFTTARELVNTKREIHNSKKEERSTHTHNNQPIIIVTNRSNTHKY